MESSFVSKLLNFATSMPIDDSLCGDIRHLIHDYILNTLKMDYYHVMADGLHINQEPGLGTVRAGGQPWCNDNADTVAIFGNGETSYRAQSTYAYQKMQPIWVLSENGAPLHSADQYVDHWSGAERKKLPKYRNENKFDVMTSIVVPVKQGEHVVGFACFESKKALAISKPATNILTKLAESIGATMAAHEEYKRREQCVRSNFDQLKEMAKESNSPFLRPTIFVASSSRADDSVMAIIRNVINDFRDDLEPIFWKEDKAVGAIPEHLQETIAECRFGICYFSEPDDSAAAEALSRDNPNVMYEAGMLESLYASPIAAPKGWVPIRDIDSPQPAPFDFSHKDMILVERLGEEKKEINGERLKSDLAAKLKLLIARNPVS